MTDRGPETEPARRAFAALLGDVDTHGPRAAVQRAAQQLRDRDQAAIPALSDTDADLIDHWATRYFRAQTGEIAQVIARDYHRLPDEQRSEVHGWAVTIAHAVVDYRAEHA